MKQTHVGRLILLILCFSSVLVFQKYYLYHDQNIENIEINMKYINRSLNRTYYKRTSIKIIKPANTNQDKLPACILIHGDNIDSHSMNLLKLELLRNKYLVVLLDISEFNFTLYFHLNETLNYLLERPDVNATQIGIIGHSRGGHYALHFACMRNNSINAVICGNYGTTFEIYYDYFDYYLKNVEWNITFDGPVLFAQWQNLTIPANANTPRNLFILTDFMDASPKRNPNTFLSYLTVGKYSQINKLFGEFENKSARELFVSNSIFGHLSSIYNPEVIYLEISWINRALGVINSANEPLVVYFNTYFEISLIILLVFFSCMIIRKSYSILLKQDNYINILLAKIRQIISRLKLKFQKQMEDKKKKNRINIISEKKNYQDFKKKSGLKNNHIQQIRPQTEVIIRISIIIITFTLIFMARSGIPFPDLIQYWIFWSLMLLILEKPISYLIIEKKWRIYKKMDYLKFILIGIELYPLIWLLFKLVMFDLVGDYPFMIAEYNYYYVLYFLLFEVFLFRIIFELDIIRTKRISKGKGKVKNNKEILENNH
ncbi:MAG: alpha/beta hydrolase family protein [Promethearchaeota archaeon]